MNYIFKIFKTVQDTMSMKEAVRKRIVKDKKPIKGIDTLFYIDQKSIGVSLECFKKFSLAIMKDDKRDIIYHDRDQMFSNWLYQIIKRRMDYSFYREYKKEQKIVIYKILFYKIAERKYKIKNVKSKKLRTT